MAIRTHSVAALAAFALAGLATPSSAEEVGTSCADCPNYSAAYSIENATGVAIRYQYRWGNKHAWKSMTLLSGYTETHSYPLGEDKHGKVPTPYVRFDKYGGDTLTQWQEYKIPFYAVGYAGFGPVRDTTEPKPYFFQYGGNGRSIDLKSK